MLSRPIISLKKLISGKIDRMRPSAEDYERLKAGYVFKVIDTRTTRGDAFRYAKDFSEAKAFSMIKTRGLLRVSWGLNLDKFNNGRLPRTIKKTIRENKEVAQYRDANDIQIKTENDTKYIEITSRVPIASRYREYLANSGLKYGQNAIRSFMKATLKKKVQELMDNAGYTKHISTSEDLTAQFNFMPEITASGARLSLSDVTLVRGI